MKHAIFIGYRRIDSGDTAGRINDELEKSFGSGRIFKDVDNIPIGANFRQFVQDIIPQCRVFLALIGRDWTSARGEDGQLRLFSPDDLVRTEIEVALSTENLLVVPVLVNGATMPKKEELPTGIQALCDINAASIRPDPDFRRDMTRLVKALKSHRPLDEEISASEILHAGAHRTEDKDSLPNQHSDRLGSDRPSSDTDASLSAARSKFIPKPNHPVRVFGIGGAGQNCLETLSENNISTIDLIAVNTDKVALGRSSQKHKILIGEDVTAGLGSGSNTALARSSAQLSAKTVHSFLEGTEILFVVVGLGGGTGGGAAPVVAEIAQAMNITVVGIASLPFLFEGQRRMALATASLEQLHPFLDGEILLHNQDIFKVADERTTFADAFKLQDKNTIIALRSMVDLFSSPGTFQTTPSKLADFLKGIGRVQIGHSSANIPDEIAEALRTALSHSYLTRTAFERPHKVIINVASRVNLSFSVISMIAKLAKSFLPKSCELLIGSSRNELLVTSFEFSTIVSSEWSGTSN